MACICVVEDDEAVRTMVTTCLQRSGFTVVTAGDGVEALLLLRSMCPDLIVMDMGLPKLNG